MRSLALLFLLFLFASTVLFAQAQISQEEKIVKSAYGKLRAAVTYREVYEYAKNPAGKILAQRISDNDLHFTLSDVRVGYANDILTEKYSSLATKPSGGRVIRTGLVTQPGDTGTESTFATAAWSDGQTVTENWEVPTSEVFKVIHEEQGITVSRYLACTVTLDFQRESITYKAVWLFGTGRNGAPITQDGDNVAGINGSALHALMDKTIYPSVILDTDLKDAPGVREWFQANTAPDCGNTKRDVCCDSSTIQCGVSTTDLERSLNMGKTYAN